MIPSRTLETKPAAPPRGPSGEPDAALGWCRRALFFWLPILYLLIVDAFYLRTYDSAQIKITLVQMGGVCLIALWMCMMSLEGWNAVGREDLVVLAPFAAYLVIVIASFARAPYPGPSVDDFVRYMFYAFVSIMVIREFDSGAVSRLTTVLLAATWITVGYGVLQWIDVNFFMGTGPGGGVDPFIWRGAFIKRVFSTFGNPNFFADYLVLVFPIVVTQFMKTRAWNLVVLIAMLLWCLFFTETKGAWIGFTVSTALFMVAYAYFFSGGDRRIVLKRVGTIALVIVVCFSGLVGYYVMRRKTSVSFRVLTWLSTWEMIETHPLLGTGVGSFKVIYPAFRRPGIFHIEGKHNTETDHAEDEYLEEWFDNGLVGFGVFLWLLVSTVWIGLQALSQLTDNLKGSRPPPRAYDLLGYLVAFVGMMAHNSFDVSLRFVSSGVFLGLLPGVIVNLSRGYPLGWLQQKRLSVPQGQGSQGAPGEADAFAILKLALFAVVAVAWGWTVLTYAKEFDELQGPLTRITGGGEALQWWVSWGCFFFLAGGFAITFSRAAYLSRSFLVPILALAVLAPLRLFWGYFKADIHHNLAIFYSKERQWDKAIENYIEVNRLNPYFVMPYYFEGNVFSDRFDLTKRYEPKLGDPKDTPRDDFERASEAYAKVRAQAPNYVQMHHQVGALYQKMGDQLMREGKTQEAQAFYDRALARFDMYHELDPVFPLNYYREAQIYLGRKDFDKAIATYKEYIEAPRCHGHPGLETSIKTKGHDDPEAYTNLGNAYFLKGDVAQARASYQKALEIDPHFENARRNLGLIDSQKRS